MEGNKGEMCCSGEHKGMCGGRSMYHGEHTFKRITIIAAMLFMFWIGLQLGELRTLSRTMMMGGHQNYGYRMMGGNEGVIWDTSVESQSGTAVPVPEKGTVPAGK